MPLSNTPSFLKLGIVCATAALFLPGTATAQAHTKNITLTDNLLSFSDGHELLAPSFNPSYGTLTDVTLILKLNGQSYTLFNSNDPSEDLVNLDVTPLGGGSSFNGADFSSWNKAEGYIDLSCTLPPGKTASGEGPATSYFFDTPYFETARCLQIDYSCELGQPSSTPEPSAKYLGAIAATVMAWLLFRRGSQAVR